MSGEGNPPYNVVVVDDTIENLRLLATILGDAGYEVRPVTNGRQALLAIERDPPDLILLDITMPDMDGYEVCARLKQRDDLRDIPVMFLTALTDTADKVRAFEAGGVDYISKPFQVEEVLARVKAHVLLRRAQTELSHSYDRLRGLEQLRDDLVHMVVHDMRTPLMVLLMSLARVEERVAGAGLRALEELSWCADAARMLERMTNDLLDVSKLEAGQLPLEKRRVDLVAIAEEVIGALSGLDRERPVSLVSHGPVEADCDPVIVRRVIENLVSNGIKHTPTGSALRLTLARVPAGVRVEVQDEGPGVPAGLRERIFEKFATVARRGEARYHSAGLGLAFCKLALQAHGGRIGVEPVEPRGSRFWFELPAR